jgi:hypothetical protein
VRLYEFYDFGTSSVIYSSDNGVASVFESVDDVSAVLPSAHDVMTAVALTMYSEKKFLTKVRQYSSQWMKFLRCSHLHSR